MNLFSFTKFGFVSITLVYLAILILTISKAVRKSGLPEKQRRSIVFGFSGILVIWLAITGILASMDFFSNFQQVPPRFFILIIVPMVLIIWACTRKVTATILSTIPPHQLVLLQSFRIFVELLLWTLLVEDLMPVQMSFEGYNFDVLSGISAVLVGYLLYRGKISKTAVIVWNVCGLILLLNIVTIAILSTPAPFRVFMNEPANTIVTKFPIVWLPAALVPLAYGLHILSIKQMLARKIN